MSTAAVPFSPSSSSVAAARSFRPVRSTLVAPMLPEPIARRSVVPATRVSSRPKGMEPSKIADRKGDDVVNDGVHP